MKMKDLEKIIAEVSEKNVDLTNLKSETPSEYVKLLEETIPSMHEMLQNANKKITELNIILESKNKITRTRDHKKRIETALSNLEEYTKFDQCIVLLKNKDGVLIYEASTNLEGLNVKTDIKGTVFEDVLAENKSRIIKLDYDYFPFFKGRDAVIVPCGDMGILIASSLNYEINKGDEDFLNRYVDNCMKQSLINAKAYEEAHDEANIDGLTKIFNFRYFNKRLIYEIEKLGKEEKLSLIMFDIDNFKKYNDVYGHLQGDEALRRFAELLKSYVREDDFGARYGGEEFVVVLPKTDQNHSERFVRRIFKNLEELTIPDIKDSDIKGKYDGNNDYNKICVSCGIYVYSVDQNYIYGLKSSEDKIKHIIGSVDNALYEAKKSGKCTYRVFKPL